MAKQQVSQNGEKRYRALFDHMTSGVAVYKAIDNGEDFIIVDFNPGAERIENIAKNEVIGKRLSKVFPGAREFGIIEALQRCWQTGISEELSLNYYHDSRISGWRENHIYKLPSEEVVAVYNDVTERYETEVEKKTLGDQLRQAQKMEAVGQLTAGIAHNFNNALQGVLGNVQIVLMDCSQEQYPFLNDIEHSAIRAGEMVKQLLMFSRQQSPKQLNVFNIRDAIEGAIKLCKRTFDREIKIQTWFADEPLLIKGDVNQIEQVILNLCLNARDALDGYMDDKCCIRVFASIAMVEDISYVLVQVADNGIGMDYETQMRVFDPFYTTKTVGEGTGLGLATAYGIVRDHKGRIECESVLGEGSTFSFWVPSVYATSCVRESTDERQTIPGGNETILVVDDETPIRHSLSFYLEKKGYLCRQAKDGKEAIKVLSEHSDIDLAILDLSMPELSGEQVLQHIREFFPRLKVIVFTGFSLDGSLEVEVDAVIGKPLDLHEMSITIRRVLDEIP